MQWSAQAEKLASETPNVMATDIDAQIMGEDSEMQACRASTACCMLYIECCMLLPGEHSGTHARSAPLALSGYSVGTRQSLQWRLTTICECADSDRRPLGCPEPRWPTHASTCEHAQFPQRPPALPRRSFWRHSSVSAVSRRGTHAPTTCATSVCASRARCPPARPP